MKKFSKKKIIICSIMGVIVVAVIMTASFLHIRSQKSEKAKKENSPIIEQAKEELQEESEQEENQDIDKADINQDETNAKEKTDETKEEEKKEEKEQQEQQNPTEQKPQAAKPTTAQEYLNAMTLEEKVYQMFIVLPEQITNVSTVTQSGETTRQGIQKYPVGGIIYMGKNIVNPTQCKSMISGVQSYSKIPLFIAVDEEGGRVARIANNSAMGTTKFPDMAYIQTTDEAYHLGKTIGSEIGQLGFNLDFAPVADVNSNPNNPVIGDRAFSSDPNKTGELVAAAVKGFKSSNMLCTLKHFPGHGDTSTDSHNGYSEVNKTLQELESLEFIPFIAGTQAGAEFVMMGHLSVPKVTGNGIPATLSPTMVGLLRDNVGFEGIIITDAMNMGAITKQYSSVQASIMAVQAGIDVILMPKNLQESANGVIQAIKSGVISETRINDSVLRILQMKINHGIIR